MIIAINGLLKTTLLDYPEHIAATIFIGSCNFRCPYCHNKPIVLTPELAPKYSETEILSFLKKRRNVLEGVCISGGEPTFYPNLIDFIRQIKALGFLVKLDTNGTNPNMVKELAACHSIDYVAMDIKSSIDSYPKACGQSLVDIHAIEETVEFLRTASSPGAFDYEFRTTLVKELITEAEIRSIGHWLQGCKAYYLQAFRDSDSVIQKGLHAFSPEEMEHFQAILKPYIPNTFLRGI